MTLRVPDLAPWATTDAATAPPAVLPSSPAVSPSSLPDPTRYRWTVVPHTHWDREWYQTFEAFRIRLARMIDAAVDAMEADPRLVHFTLDGQSVILEDYAELRGAGSARVERLLALVRAGRISVGPAYVLPDEFLTDAEALVRTWLVGKATCERFDVPAAPIGYLPDEFGHVATLPSILAGFGIDHAFLWRGFGDEADDLGVAFDWVGPDGSSILGLRLLAGYGGAAELGRWADSGVSVHDDPARWPDAAAYRFVRYLARYGEHLERSGAHAALLPNGADHLALQADVPDLLEHARTVHPGLDVAIGSYADHVRDLRADLPSELPVYQGEFVSGRDANVLRAVHSARIGLKLAAERSLRSLLVAETLSSLATRRALPYPTDELGHAWRAFLRNMPHDSITGCSTDEVHRDMAARFAIVDQVAGRLTREAAYALAGLTAPWSPEPPELPAFLNPLPYERTKVVEVAVPKALRGRAIAARVGDDLLAAQVDGDVARIALPLPGFGGRTIELVADGRPAAARADAAFASDGRSIANGILTVTAGDDGSLTVRDARSGRSFAGVARLEDVADCGDEYTFDPLPDEMAWTSAGTVRPRVRVLASGPVEATLEISYVASLPRRLRGDRRARVRARVACPIRLVARLGAGEDRVRLDLTVENHADDHRMRLLVDAPAAEPPIRAEGHFDVIRRGCGAVGSGDGWMERPSPTSHQAGFVAAGPVVLFAPGVPEYEAIQTEAGITLALTLLRCVGILGQTGLRMRPEDAGPPIPTPDAQCRGEHSFSLAIAFDADETSDVELVRRSADLRTPFVAAPAGADAGGLVGSLPADAAFAALKMSEDGAGLVLRAYAPGRSAVALPPLPGAVPCRLDETPTAEAAPSVLAPGGILTLRLPG